MHITIPDTLVVLVHVAEQNSIAQALAESDCVFFTRWKINAVFVSTLKKNFLDLLISSSNMVFYTLKKSSKKQVH